MLLKKSGSLDVVIVFGTLVIGAGVAFLFTIVVAHLIGPSGAGLYFIALTVIDISVTIARFGARSLGNPICRHRS